MRFYIRCLLFLLLSLPLALFADILAEDETAFVESRGITVETPVSHFYPQARNNPALYKVLQQAEKLTQKINRKRDGVPYKQHSWNAGSDEANLKRGIDCSRAIWYVFTRAGLRYNKKNSYIPTAYMYQDNSQMRHYFERCSIHQLQLGDVLVYRGPGKYGRGQAGHTVMVLDPGGELAWGSHGWDGSGKSDTGVEVQRVVPDGWGFWDRKNMKFKACWRHKDFKATHTTPIVEALPETTAVGTFPETKTRRLNNADLADKTPYQLWLMRNEMFARYGYIFRNQRLARHFQRQSWYRPVRNRSLRSIHSHLFSNIERHNAAFIKDYEKHVKEKPRHHPSGVYPYTSTRKVTVFDLLGKSAAELRLMRNEIYARNGYCFGVKDLKTYFNRQSWYRCNTYNGAKVYEQRFSTLERENVKFIKRYESIK